VAAEFALSRGLGFFSAGALPTHTIFNSGRYVEITHSMFFEHFYLVNICLESVTLIHGIKQIYSFAIVCKRYKTKS